ncbi:MAG: hypothetical protein WC989_04680 [Micavibrio sp.]
MGDITGRPKTPRTEVVYVPQYIYQDAGSAGGQPSGSAAGGGEETTPEKEREKTLLGRTRSRLGTILTGFRGILAPSETQSQRKTLLGE